MTDTEINIAIAEVCGWRFGKPHLPHTGEWTIHFGNPPFEFDSTWAGTPPPTEECNKDYSDVPDYCHDLNAMHEVEHLMDGNPAALDRYHRELSRQVTNISVALEDITAVIGRYRWHATARQRAIAFLKTIGHEEKEHQ